MKISKSRKVDILTVEGTGLVSLILYKITGYDNPWEWMIYTVVFALFWWIFYRWLFRSLKVW